MQTLRIQNAGDLRLVDQPEPERPADECRVAVLLAGICRTDLELAKGYMDFRGIPGHEFVGRVIEAPDGHHGLLGRRVVGEINVPEGIVSRSIVSDPRHFPHRTVLGILNRSGAFAETLLLPPENLLAVPDEVSTEEAVFTEPLAAALEILEQIHIPPGEKVLVIGDGKLGLLIAQVMRRHGCHVCLWGHHDKKLALARRWRIQAVNTGSCDLDDSRSSFPVVVEATGSADGFRQALAAVRPKGTVVLKSTYAAGEKPSFDAARIVVDEITLVGSRCGRFAPALRQLALGGIDVKSLIEHELPLGEGPRAFELAGRRESLKVLLRVSQQEDSAPFEKFVS